MKNNSHVDTGVIATQSEKDKEKDKEKEIQSRRQIADRSTVHERGSGAPAPSKEIQGEDSPTPKLTSGEQPEGNHGDVAVEFAVGSEDWHNVGEAQASGSEPTRVAEAEVRHTFTDPGQHACRASEQGAGHEVGDEAARVQWRGQNGSSVWTTSGSSWTWIGS